MPLSVPVQPVVLDRLLAQGLLQLMLPNQMVVFPWLANAICSCGFWSHILFGLTESVLFRQKKSWCFLAAQQGISWVGHQQHRMLCSSQFLNFFPSSSQYTFLSKLMIEQIICGIWPAECGRKTPWKIPIPVSLVVVLLHCFLSFSPLTRINFAGACMWEHRQRSALVQESLWLENNWCDKTSWWKGHSK